MKKSILLLAGLILIMGMSGCQNRTEVKESNKTETPERVEGESKETTYSFEAIVTEVNEQSFMVEPVEGSWILNSADLISVPFPEKIDADKKAAVAVGAKVTIEFDGNIMESYPAMISNVSSISVMEAVEGNVIRQEGPYGSISLTIPEGFGYECLDVNACSNSDGAYGIRFWKEGEERKVFLQCMEPYGLGVCGTGLETEEITLAADAAMVGRYDGQEAIDFIIFSGKNGKLAAIFEGDAKWDQAYENNLIAVLDTLVYDNTDLSGAICVYQNDSEAEELGLLVKAEQITVTGAVIVFEQWDESAKKELSFGQAMILEKKEGDSYKEAKVIVEGDYGYKDIAYNIAPASRTEYALDWEWIYGEIEAGDYRIRIPVSYEKDDGTYGKKELYVYFIMR